MPERPKADPELVTKGVDIFVNGKPSFGEFPVDIDTGETKPLINDPSAAAYHALLEAGFTDHEIAKGLLIEKELIAKGIRRRVKNWPDIVDARREDLEKAA